MQPQQVSTHALAPLALGRKGTFKSNMKACTVLLTLASGGGEVGIPLTPDQELSDTLSTSLLAREPNVLLAPILLSAVLT